MLPSFICRSFAERKLVVVVEVINETLENADLATAFEILREQIDLLKNLHRALRNLLKVEWQVGEDVDEFSYRFKDLSSEANTNLRVACSMFSSQMPNSMQPTLLEWLDRQEDMRTGGRTSTFG